MKVLDDGNLLEIKFSPGNALEIDRKNGILKYRKRFVKFDDVRGFWKNFVVKRRKKYYYVVLLTEKWMDRITPEMDEYDVDEVVHYLTEILGEDKYARGT